MIEEELIMSKIYISQLFNDNEIIDFLKDRDIGPVSYTHLDVYKRQRG